MAYTNIFHIFPHKTLASLSLSLSLTLSLSLSLTLSLSLNHFKSWKMCAISMRWPALQSLQTKNNQLIFNSRFSTINLIDRVENRLWIIARVVGNCILDYNVEPTTTETETTPNFQNAKFRLYFALRSFKFTLCRTRRYCRQKRFPKTDGCPFGQ